VGDRNLTFDFTAPPPPAPSKPEPPRALSVAELDRAIKDALEADFAAPVFVEGEVSNARPAPSGHVYFSLKDEKEDASIDAVIYRASLTARMRSLLVDGSKVRVRARPTFWAPRGRLQLVVDRVDAVGRGALLEALEKLKEKLQTEGLFAPERKRPLPKEPRVIGVVTSAAGAAIHDVCKVAFRRGGARILLAPAVVQGQGAAESIRRALALLQRVRGVDVIIVGRGGGSADDLSAFNDEALVRAVAASRVPVVSAVGHEVDVTLVDFAADARAATPSQAAELLVPDRRERLHRVKQASARLVHAMRARLAEDRVRLHRVERALGDPRFAIAAKQQSVDDAADRLARFARRAIDARRATTSSLAQRIAAHDPRVVLARRRAAVERATARMEAAVRAQGAARVRTASSLAARLDALSPLKVLGRGYAIATRADGSAVRDAREVRRGERIEVRVARGRIAADVMDVTPDEDEA
jgi:exodeoxyribonuclease VII large subunit